MKFLIIILLVVSCGKGRDLVPGKYEIYKDNIPMERLDGRPTVLVIGDSISIGYTPFLKEAYPEYQVIHNGGNARNSGFGEYMIMEWLNHSEYWEICIVNHGLWDVKLDPVWNTTEAEYQTNLMLEILRMKSKCGMIIAPNTTRVPINSPHFDIDKRVSHNAVFESLMTSMDIPVCDLSTVSETITHLHVNAVAQDDVHYLSDGYEILANEIVNCIDSQ